MRYGWTLEKQQWDHLLSAFSGLSWSKTKLTPLFRDDVPERQGVYVICAKIPAFDQSLSQVLYNIIYVGKADRGTLRTRFLRHCRKPKREIELARQCFGDSLEYWFASVRVNQIAELEARLIDCFGPPANLRRGSLTMKLAGTSQPAGRFKP